LTTGDIIKYECAHTYGSQSIDSTMNACNSKVNIKGIKDVSFFSKKKKKLEKNLKTRYVMEHKFPHTRQIPEVAIIVKSQAQDVKI
jgi:hypothetical protein